MSAIIVLHPRIFDHKPVRQHHKTRTKKLKRPYSLVSRQSRLTMKSVKIGMAIL